MTNDRITALLAYIVSTLSDRSFTLYKGAYYWTNEELEVAPDLRPLDAGWLVILETGPNAIYINFAESVPPLMQERLKTLIGHCVVEQITCYSPWLVSNPAPACSSRNRIHSLLQ